MVLKRKKRGDNNIKDRRGFGGIFIPAGLFLGMGVGFLVDELVAGMFIGLGVGFLLFGIASLFRGKNNMKKMDRKIIKNQITCNTGSCGCGGAGYGLGFIGSVIYYVSTASGFWMGVLGILKSMVWPAFLVYELLKFLMV